MRYVTKCATLAIALVMTSACGPRERLKTVSDFCLNSRILTVEPAPAPGVDDPGNRFDTDETANAVLEQNAVTRSLCPNRAPAPPSPPAR